MNMDRIWYGCYVVAAGGRALSINDDTSLPLEGNMGE